MKIMITGATGMLGQDVIRELTARGHVCCGTGSADFDLQDASAVRAAVADFGPEAIVHCAAYTAVDLAESEPHRCAAVNALGTLHLARAAAAVGAKLLYISTDYVFDGAGDAPHAVTERPRPLNVYGLSKLQGEEAVRALLPRSFILRTSWVYGRGGRSFVSTMMQLGQEKPMVRVVADQWGAPTCTTDLARLIADMIVTDRYGVYHAAGEGCCSFAELAQAIMRITGSRCRVQPIPSAEYPSVARRPRNSRLDMSCLDANGFRRLPAWEESLYRFIRGQNA